VSVSQVLDFTRQICQALKWAHQQGIVHRDLKPANLLLDAFGIVKLVDFGLARVDPNLRESLASSRGAGMFTFAYASPEQLEGQTEIDSRSDLFSLGATLHHLVTGKPPLTRNYSLKLVPVVLRPLFERLLEHGVDERFQSVSEVLQMISDLSQGGAGPAAPESGPAVAARQPAAAVSALVVPFSASAAKSAQRALSRQLGQAEELTNDLEMKFRLIPGGTFAMGSAAGQGSKDEHPQHKVTLSRAFYLGVHTVTQGQWQQLMGTTPWQGQEDVKIGGTIAATYISWEDSVQFCQRLSAREGRRYRLPTEAEWEWSCRAGTTTQYSFGDDEQQLKQYAWYGAGFFSLLFGSGSAEAVGQKSANPFGLYDMHGNVYEWCSDWYDSGYYSKSPEQNPTGPASGSSRVLRGGGWSSVPIYLRSCYRYCDAPGNRYYYVGLRVLCELE
jgi:formylglycine-generating enzyme required for sulfatase activity